ncbi:hypothetical protein LTR85_011516 [Meristemomyces frigidus]|nr:hypothetical protein LTR85_011516 [Meristemomyces frigidus]
MFVAFQRTIFAKHGIGHVVMDGSDPEHGWRTFSASEIAFTMESFPELETTYDKAAIESYLVFSHLKRNGALPKELRFQVCIPTPANFIGCNIQPDFQSLVEPHYEAALLRASEKTQAAIPHRDLAIQIDLTVEFAYLTGQGYDFWRAPVPYLPLDDKHALFEKLVSSIVTLADGVAKDVRLGFHFCYGDLGAKHLTEPEDVSLIVEVATALRQRVARRIDWMHMPVRKDRTDEAYIAPLANLLPLLDPETDIYLGLVHASDDDDTRARLASAQKVLGERRFGISTECGLGRRSEKDLERVVEVLRAVSAS